MYVRVHYMGLIALHSIDYFAVKMHFICYKLTCLFFYFTPHDLGVIFKNYCSNQHQENFPCTLGARQSSTLISVIRPLCLFIVTTIPVQLGISLSSKYLKLSVSQRSLFWFLGWETWGLGFPFFWVLRKPSIGKTEIQEAW